MTSRCEDCRFTGDVLDELPNFHIDIFSELEEHPGRFAENSESDVDLPLLDNRFQRALA